MNHTFRSFPRRRLSQTGIKTVILIIFVSAILLPFARDAAAVSQPTIMFVTQPPHGDDFAAVNSVFGNHLARADIATRGGDLYIRYGDGTLRNLTAEAGFGLAVRQDIAVREPSIHWSGNKALFSMVVGGTTLNDLTSVYWQLYEITGFGQGQRAVITKLAQPTDSNNVSPIYGTDDRIIFTSDRPRNGNRALYPQLDEYESTATNTGIWSMNPDGSDLRLLDHAVSGDFTPIIASDGRLLFTRWDHLQRDQQSNEGTLSYGAFNYASETSAQQLSTSAEVYPELRVQPAGSFTHGHTMNQFFPWQMNEDGTGLETLNHIGRHEFLNYFDSAHNGLPEFIGPTGRRSATNILQMKEDPTRPGYFFATSAAEFRSHAAGQIIGLNSPESLNPDNFQVDYIQDPIAGAIVEDGQTAPSNHPGHFRNPTPLTDGSLVAVRTTSPFGDRAVSGQLSSRYDFHLVRLARGTPYWSVAERLIPTGISKSVSYWDNQTFAQVSYSGPMWELDPVEVVARTRPARHSTPLPDIEAQILRDELGSSAAVDQFAAFLRSRNLALVVSRNVTRRADRQQDFNLRIANSTTVTADTGATPIDIAFLQFYQGDLIRGYGNLHAGRRPIAQVMHDGLNPDVTGAPAGSVKLGADGSMAALVPASRALSWQLTKQDGSAVVRERYWVTFAPGEMRSCANCHGINTTDTVLHLPPPTNPPEALRDLARWYKANFASSGCAPAITSASQSFPAAGGTASITVTAGSGCAWSAVSNSPFLTITSGASGSGGGSVSYSVAANASTISRTGTLTVAGLTFTVSQSGAQQPCSYSISPANQLVSASGGPGTVVVTAGAGCSWSAISNAAFLTVTSSSSGVGAGSVQYSVAANTSPNTRSGTLTIAGQTFLISQNGGLCTYSISPGSQSFDSTGGSGIVAVSAGAECPWSAVSNAAFISVTSGATGSGSGSVGFRVSSNTSASSRAGTLTIAGQTFTVTQNGSTPVCTFVLSPKSQEMGFPASSGSIQVVADGGCAWSASVDVEWLTLTSSSGTGAGRITFTVAKNKKAKSRTATITVAGESVTVTQRGRV